MKGKRVSSQLLKVLQAPGFVHSNNAKASELSNQLRKDLGGTLIRDRYNDHLKYSDSLVMFSWLPYEGTMNKHYYWDSFAKQNNRGTFFRQPIQSNEFEKEIQLPFLDSRTDYRLWFQDNMEIDNLNSILKSTLSNDKLQVECVGLNINARENGSSIAKHIQSLLIESTEKYKNIDYEKLLQIAKNKDIPDIDKSIKQFLLNLADLELSKPNLVQRNQWLLFTKNINST
ncbi:hypothetical protein Kpol_1018p184 [Vanderwaltozyma polyspora DSM 70294]|uniref:Uncharacterized protein n=1 Tax=Vanderwaltozyma polyspora (strain ATCC 22028 / DSM 70294 / BCRC 21397 / CBS 2163 / NBRC 10782 / NRRL Y-8283 / UCD 57-17) TaxID=436907 RepID=A7TE24_VANPO|nr:uncharacterized protein Kpol_1018p184 [Vanderwaltozyma polyspora DSM 70294]EDO19644.1 hypothetical protein Kpol_1018p184 [Vanderwaltozyma polyspora DSM 70294]